MSTLSGEQLEAACELVETMRMDRETEAAEIIAELCAAKLKAVITSAELTPAYNKWKRRQRIVEDHGDETGAATDPDTLEAPEPVAPDAGCAVQEIIGKLLTYMGQSMLREKYVWKSSEIRLREGETILKRNTPGCITLPCGTFVEWIICAILIQKDGVAVRALPECRYRSRLTRGGRETISYDRMTCVESAANMKALASSVGALQYLYCGGKSFPGHQLTSARRLAAALGVTVANISHHMRNMAGKAVAPGGHARFAVLKKTDTLPVAERMRAG